MFFRGETEAIGEGVRRLFRGEMDTADEDVRGLFRGETEAIGEGVRRLFREETNAIGEKRTQAFSGRGTSPRRGRAQKAVPLCRGRADRPTEFVSLGQKSKGYDINRKFLL